MGGAVRGTALEGEAAVATLRELGVQESKAHRRWRLLEDRWTRILMAAGGVAVIITILLIFVYLLYVVLPLFASASIRPEASYPVPGGPAETLSLGTEEYAEIGLRLTGDGRAVFFKTRDGQVISDERLALPEGLRITAHAAGDPRAATLAVGLSNGTALVFRHQYSVSFPNDVRTLRPEITYPLGPAPVVIDTDGRTLVHLAVQSQDRQTTLAAATEDGRLLVTSFAVTRSLLTEGETLTRQAATIPGDNGPITHLALGLLQRELYTASGDGSIHYYDVTKKTAPTLVDKVGAVGHGQTVTAMQFLSGGSRCSSVTRRGGSPSGSRCATTARVTASRGCDRFPHRRIPSPRSRLNSLERASRPSMSPGRSGSITPPPSAPSWSSGSSSHRPTHRSRPWRCPRGRTPC